MSISFLFSGQGSQSVGMMSDWYTERHGLESTFAKASEIIGTDIKNIMFEGPKEVLTETRYTQPALYLHSALVSDYVKEAGISPDLVAGHSVGEYAALYSAGVIDFWSGLELVSLRGKLMFASGEKVPGTMFAVIGMEDEKVESFCKELNEEGTNKVVVAANFNSPGQVVISGSRDYLREIAPRFKEEGARMVKELQVSGAFHSPLLNDAKEKLAEKINSIEFKDASIPVFSNVEAAPEKNSEKIKNLLIEQLVRPVRWTSTMRAMNRYGADQFIEIGPGKVLQGLLKRTLENVKIDGVDKFEDLENLA